MPTFFKCYIGSVILYLITYCSISYTYNYYVMVILLVVSILIIGVVGMVNHPNMHMDSKELSESRRRARINLVVETGVIIISIYIGIDKVSIGYMAMGVIQCAILLCMAKIMKQEV